MVLWRCIYQLHMEELNNPPFIWQNFSVNFRPDSVDKNVIQHSFDNDIFYSRVKEFQPTSFMNIVDIGAHIGTFSILSASKFKDAKIFAFEPFPETYELLKRNINENNIHQIKPFENAIASTNDTLKLYLSDENWEHSIANVDSKEFIEVKGKKIDTLIKEVEIDKIDLVKFNCEGAEFEILNSISHNSYKIIRLMVILYHEDMAKGQKVENLFSLLENNGFMYRVINKTKNRGWVIAKNKNYYSTTENTLVDLNYKFSTILKRKKNQLKQNIKWLIKKL